VGDGAAAKRNRWLVLVLLALALAGGPAWLGIGESPATAAWAQAAPVTGAGAARPVPAGAAASADDEAGFAVEGAFARFWERHGGLARFGRPLSPAVHDPAAGELVVQYFERARFELHPEGAPAYLVELTLLGKAALGDRPERAAPPAPCADDCELFAATGHTLRDTFRRFWGAGGGLPVFGFPLTEELREVNAADGRPYTVQYFERARFELHPEYAGTAYEVLLGHLGREALAARPEVAGLPRAAVPDEPGPAGKTIVLDVGHDRKSGGALGIEYRDTLRTSLAIARELVARGYTVYLTRDDNETVLLDDPALLPPDAATTRYDPGYLEGYAHASKTLALAPDLAISVHYNAAPSGPGGGSTTYYCELGGPRNRRLAELVQAEIALALADRGYRPPYSRVAEDAEIGKAYGHLATLGNVNDPRTGRTTGNRMPGLPIVLTEALFETNPTERALIADDETIARLAVGYARAVDAFFASGR
jgi:N-acetylmuramoyl-L-alanine amidase